MSGGTSVLEGKPDSVNEHFKIFDAMNGHRAVLRRLSGLVDKVEGTVQPEEDKATKEASPTLGGFLDLGEEKMKVMTDILATQIDKLEKMLF